VHNTGVVDIMVVQGRKLLKAWTRRISSKKVVSQVIGKSMSISNRYDPASKDV
jgi:hypothetical protein